MKKFFKLLSIFCLVLLTAQACFALDSKIGDNLLVLPDNLQFESTNYLVYPDSSVIFASDTINLFKKTGKIESVSMHDVREKFRKNLKLQLLAKNILKEYKYNYNVSFVDLKTLAHAFSTNKVLLITSTTDVQNYILRRTVWDVLNIQGANVINPAYRLSTYVALVDVDKEEVLWQKTFHKNINSFENRIVAVSFAPATEQLEHIKFYSEYVLSPEIAGVVEAKLAPPPVMSVEGDIIQPSFGADKIPTSTLEGGISGTKPFVPTRPRLKSNGVMVNDL